MKGSSEEIRSACPSAIRLLCRLLGIAAVAHERAVEHLRRNSARVIGSPRLWKPNASPLYDVQVRQPEAVRVGGDEGELLPVIRRPHIVERAVGREMHADPVSGPDGRDESFDYFLQEAVTVQGSFPPYSSVRWFVFDWRNSSIR